MTAQQEIVLIGKPNSGKSSLFNQLTGLNQKVGNFAGVTVERKKGVFKKFAIIDLPGLKSLRITSPEEVISKNAILQHAKQGKSIVFVASGTQLEDHLILFSEIADLGAPIILVINFKDELIKNKIQVDSDKIRDLIGCPVVMTNSRKGDGLKELEGFIEQGKFSIPHSVCRSAYDDFENGQYVNRYVETLASENPVAEREEEFLKRRKTIHGLIQSSVENRNAKTYLTNTKKWDQYLLHPIYGMFFFIAIMWMVFQAVFSLSGYPMDMIDASFSALSSFAKANLPAGWINSLVSQALIPGIGGVVIFIPQIAILFFLLGVLEHVGYMSRISFISDAFLRKFGLSGKSVIPLMSSWACSIPAIMSTRVIDDPRERMAVILASPLMTCSARLPVYTILIAVVVPDDSGAFIGMKGLLLLALYLLGVIATLAVAWLVNRRSKIPSNPLWSLELPKYRMPNWRNIFHNVYNKTKSFVVEAGKVILAISILLWLLSTNSPKSEEYIDQQFQSYQETASPQMNLSRDAFDLEYSYIGYIGKFIEPTIAPLGYDWKIGIAILSSFAAREVFVGTLSTIYSIGSEEEATVVQRLRQEKVMATGKPRYDLATSISLLIFYVFAMQCMSTVAIVRKETGKWKYAIWQFFFFLFLAYGFAFIANILLS